MRRALISLVLTCAGAAVVPRPCVSQDIPESSPAAIEAHAQGVRLYLAQRYQEALPHLYEAHELDPTFYTPLFIAMLCAGNAGLGTVYDSLLAILEVNKDRFSSYYRGLLDVYAARRAGDLSRSMEVARGLVGAYPGTKVSYNYALWVQAENPREAIDALKTLDPEREPMREWFAYWDVLANSQHALGLYDDELAAATAAEQHFPTSMAPLGLQITVLASLGRTGEIESVLQRAEALPPDRGWHLGNLLIEAGVELSAHGRAAEGRQYFERALAVYDAMSTEDAAGGAMRNQRAFTLYNLGRYDEAHAVYASLARDFPNNFNWVGWVAETAALSGDRAPAEAAVQRFASGELGNNDVNRRSWQLALAASLGDTEQAVAVLDGLPAGATWMHRDPTVMKQLGRDARFKAFLESVR